MTPTFSFLESEFQIRRQEREGLFSSAECINAVESGTDSEIISDGDETRRGETSDKSRLVSSLAKEFLVSGPSLKMAPFSQIDQVFLF